MKTKLLIFIFLSSCIHGIKAQQVHSSVSTDMQLEMIAGSMRIMDLNGPTNSFQVKPSSSDNMLLQNGNVQLQNNFSVNDIHDSRKYTDKQIRVRRIVGWTLIGMGASLLTWTSVTIFSLKSSDKDCRPQDDECGPTLPYGIIFSPAFLGVTVLGISGTIPLVKVRKHSRSASVLMNAPHQEY